MHPLYSLSNIEHRQGSFCLAIDRLDLLPGRLYALAGPNGAGKSTLLRLLALLEAPQRGEMLFAGVPVGRAARALCREVTLVHQSPYLFAGSVFTNVAYGLKLRGMRGEELRQRVEQALGLVGLAGFAERRARDLSGGETQRVAMARALALGPRVLLLDEPLANVDRESAAILERAIVALPAAGTTVVMTTHDPRHPGRLGGEPIRLEAGRLVAAPEVHPKGMEHKPIAVAQEIGPRQIRPICPI